MQDTIFTIREARLADMDRLLDLEYRAFLGLNDGNYTEEILKLFIGEMKRVTPELLAEGRYYVFEDEDGDIIASGGWSQETPGYAHGIEGHAEEYRSDEGVVRAMYVSPDMARRGLGRKMMELIEERAMAEGVRKLAMSATIMGAGLYSACGYKITGPTIIALSEGRQITGHEMEKILVPNGQSIADIAGAAA
ncbi:MAG: GNAT family N-acetyltransferase [Boseongicola sp.]|nr:MAG: GNAT family N-acetyltransferase [Boseongicola sp.]